MPQSLTEISPAQLKNLKPFLDEAAAKNEIPEYIEDDPVCFIHAFDKKEDRALAGFFAALMAWGRRDVIINKMQELLERMNYKPYDFILNFRENDKKQFEGFKHRTFKPVDIYWLVKSLKKILSEFDNFELFWDHCYKKAKKNNKKLFTVFHHQFFAFYPEIPRRTRKHISNPAKNSACKRLCLFLKWMIRKNSPVDAGIMNFMPPSELFIPLDVHVARHARVLGLLTRKQNDWKAVEQLTQKLRTLGPDDPSKYDYALFGLGVNGQVIPSEFILNPQFSK